MLDRKVARVVQSRQSGRRGGSTPLPLAPMFPLHLSYGALCSVMLIACGATSLPRPDTVAQPRSAFQRVPYPPPAALVEVLPPRPASDAVWVDGHWEWRAGRYVWERGGWMRPPEGAVLSQWNLFYRYDGALFFAPNIWRNAAGAPIEPPEMIAPANPPKVETIGEHSTPP